MVLLQRYLATTSLLLIASSALALPMDRLRFPPGFKLEQVAQVDNARQLALAPDGTLFVGSYRAGKVYRLAATADGYAQPQVIIDDLPLPSGITFHQGALYIAALNRILRLDNPLSAQPATPVILTDQLPQKKQHGWKYLKVGPDQQLYFNIGAPCNSCLSDNPLFATLARMPLSGGPVEVIAQGVRNSVGFGWHPADQALWFTDNGRDWLGDNSPDDELNRLAQPGQHFGFPYRHARTVIDPQYKQFPAPDSQPPVALLGAHVAPLGMAFSQQPPWAEPGETALFIAQHGSWNRTEKVGYEVIRVRLKGNKVIAQESFIKGWLRHGSYWGRPVDVMFTKDKEGADSSLLISDDYGDAIYQMTPLP